MASLVRNIAIVVCCDSQTPSLLICVDEAYMLLERGKFEASHNETFSFLSPLVMSTCLPGILLTLAGTSMQLAKVSLEAESAVTKSSLASSSSTTTSSNFSNGSDLSPSSSSSEEYGISHMLSKSYLFTRFKPVETQFIDQMLKKFIGTDLLNTHIHGKTLLSLIHQVYEGSRARLFMNFLRAVIFNHIPKKKSKLEFLEPFRQHVKTMGDPIFRLFHVFYYSASNDALNDQKEGSLVSTLTKFCSMSRSFTVNNETYSPSNLLGFLLERYLFFGNRLHCYGNYQEEMINNSICLLRKVDGDVVAEVSEFLLIEALMKLKKRRKISLIHEHMITSELCDPQFRGKLMEYSIAERLFSSIRKSDGALNCWQPISGLDLPDWCRYSYLSATNFRGRFTTDLSYDIDKSESTDCFLFPGNAAGPDIVFYLDSTGSGNQKRVVFCQCKVMKKFISGKDATHCIRTTNCQGTYIQKNKQQPKGKLLTQKVKNNFDVGMLRILVVYPGIAQGNGRITSSQVVGEDVVAVIDQNNFVDILGEELYSLILFHSQS